MARQRCRRGTACAGRVGRRQATAVGYRCRGCAVPPVAPTTSRRPARTCRTARAGWCARRRSRRRSRLCRRSRSRHATADADCPDGRSRRTAARQSVGGVDDRRRWCLRGGGAGALNGHGGGRWWLGRGVRGGCGHRAAAVRLRGHVHGRRPAPAAITRAARTSVDRDVSCRDLPETPRATSLPATPLQRAGAVRAECAGFRPDRADLSRPPRADRRHP